MKTVKFRIIVLSLILCLNGCLLVSLARISQERDHPIVTSIYVSRSTVYTASWYSVGFRTIACFWTNGIRTDLPGDRGFTNSIFVSGDTVYVAGSVGDIPCFWTNGSRTDLPTGKRSAGLTRSIFVSGNAVYVAGSTTLAYNYPCYWTNGT
jgi:hypothetical protein